MAGYISDESKRKKNCSISLPNEIWEQLDRIAQRNRVTRSSQILAIIQGYLLQDEEAEAEVIRANQKARDYN